MTRLAQIPVWIDFILSECPDYPIDYICRLGYSSGGGFF